MCGGQEGAPRSKHKARTSSPRLKQKGDSRSSTPRNTTTPNQVIGDSPLSLERSPVAMIIQPVTPDPSPSPGPSFPLPDSRGFVTPTKRNGGTTGWTHFQIKSEPSSPVPQTPQRDDSDRAGVKTEPASPRTPRSHTSVSSSPGCTPGKSNGNPGWTHLQIKSEPTSPVPGVAGGWQSISSLTTPPKVSTPSAQTVVCNNQTNSIAANSSPLFKPVSMQIGSIGSKTGTPKLDSTESTAVNSTPTINISNSNFRVGDGVITQTLGGDQSLVTKIPETPSPKSNLQGAAAGSQGIRVPAPPGKPATPANQANVYVKCIDNQGKIYLIPQHLLAKSPAATAVSSATGPAESPSGPHVRGQGQIMASPQNKGLITSPQVRGQVIVGSSPNVLIQKSGQRAPSQVRFIFTSLFSFSKLYLKKIK